MGGGQLIHHFLLAIDVESIVVDDERFVVVGRERQELRSLQRYDEVLPLVRQKSGRWPNGELELMERYCDLHDDTNSVVLDASPSWLEQLPRLSLTSVS